VDRGDSQISDFKPSSANYNRLSGCSKQRSDMGIGGKDRDAMRRRSSGWGNMNAELKNRLG
jgi:hypothetical protein